MHMPWRKGQFVKNSILARLSPADFELIRPLLLPVMLKERAVLQEPHRRVEHVHFIETGLVSLMTLAAGSVLETAMVGSGGFDPASSALGVHLSAHRSVVLIAGSAWKISADDLSWLMREVPPLRTVLLQHVQSLMICCSQTSLCVIHHPHDQRIASWLCQAADALGDDVFPITHDHLSTILGCDRAAVTKSLKRFEEEGLIQKRRGVLQIRARHALEQKACGCYAIVAKAQKRLTPADV